MKQKEFINMLVEILEMYDVIVELSNLIEEKYKFWRKIPELLSLVENIEYRHFLLCFPLGGY